MRFGVETEANSLITVINRSLINSTRSFTEWEAEQLQVVRQGAKEMCVGLG